MSLYMCGDVAACRETAYVLFSTAHTPGSVQAPWGWSKTETCRRDNYVYSSV